MTDSDSSQHEGVTASRGQSPQSFHALNESQMTPMHVVDEVSGDPDRSRQVLNTDGLNVDTLMSNISKLVSETVKKELDKVNINPVPSISRSSSNRWPENNSGRDQMNRNVNGGYGDMYQPSSVSAKTQ